jgi:hypothetical protein
MFDMYCLFLSEDFKFQVSSKVSFPALEVRNLAGNKVSPDVSTSRRRHGTLILAQSSNADEWQIKVSGGTCISAQQEMNKKKSHGARSGKYRG